MDAIDFRSDTVTWPTPMMREAMARAVVGDDVYGEDPTVNKLEALAASIVGMDTGLFVASGTMGNLVATLTHTNRGDQVIVGSDAHVYTSETGGMSVLGGVVPKPLPTDQEGKMNLLTIEKAICPEDVHYPRTRLILLENTYASKNGAPIAIEYFEDVRRIANQNGLAIHLDGARLFNAVVALGIPAENITKHVDSVSFCLSKGLCAPVGSVLCGTNEFIYQARRIRKGLGGGMRQAGILAAAGIIGLEVMICRLKEDHKRAKQLALGLNQIPGIVIDFEAIKTNIVFFQLDDTVLSDAYEVAQKLRVQSNILIGTTGPRGFRAVTHYWIDDGNVQLLVESINCAVWN